MPNITQSIFQQEDMLSEHIKDFASSKGSSDEDMEEDFINNLLKFKDSSSSLKFPFTNTTIKAMIADVFLAGTEPPSIATIWAMSELVRNPRVMTKVQAEIRQTFAGKESIDEVDIHELKYLNLVIRETLRLHPPAPLLVARECIEDCVVDGYTIYAKTMVMVNAWAIGRDPTVWPNPESFIPQRFENSNIDYMGNYFEHSPFGSGKRICPGMALAIANIELPFKVFVPQYNFLPLFPKIPLIGENIEMPKVFNLLHTRIKVYMTPWSQCTIFRNGTQVTGHSMTNKLVNGKEK